MPVHDGRACRWARWLFEARKRYHLQILNDTVTSWLDDALDIKQERDPPWTDSVAVGTKLFVERVKDWLGFKAIGRQVIEGGAESTMLKEELSILATLILGPKWTL